MRTLTFSRHTNHLLRTLGGYSCTPLSTNVNNVYTVRGIWWETPAQRSATTARSTPGNRAGEFMAHKT